MLFFCDSSSVWACFWGVWAGQGLEPACLGLGSSQGRRLCHEGIVADVRIAWLDL